MKVNSIFNESSSAILIIGPNGVGKTKIAYELARRYGGEIINLDRTYLYKHFPIATGLEDALKEQGVTRHLYELLEPLEESYSANEYSEIVGETVSQILRSGKLPIAEGASTFYVPAILKLNSKRKLFKNIIGLRFSANDNIEKKYLHRIDQAFREGLVQELEANLPKYKNSFIAKECHSAVPTIRYMNGHLNLSEAKEEILKRCLEYKDRQMKLFSSYSEIKWIEADGFNDAYAQIERIAELCK